MPCLIMLCEKRMGVRLQKANVQANNCLIKKHAVIQKQSHKTITNKLILYTAEITG